MRNARCDNHPERQAVMSFQGTVSNIGPLEAFGHQITRALKISRSHDLCVECATVLGYEMGPLTVRRPRDQREEKDMDETEIRLGERYRDTLTGFEGTAISKHEYIHGCTRVTLQTMKAGEIKDYTFDAPALVAVDTERQVTSTRTGGPRPIPAPWSAP